MPGALRQGDILSPSNPLEEWEGVKTDSSMAIVPQLLATRNCRSSLRRPPDGRCEGGVITTMQSESTLTRNDGRDCIAYTAGMLREQATLISERPWRALELVFPLC
jgi:hypothetical protein